MTERFTHYLLPYMLSRPLFTSIPTDKLQTHMQVVADAFTQTWLDTNSNNPVQQLWRRGDNNATSELLALAVSLATLQEINARWTREQVKIAKSKDLNSARGALFELLALAMLHSTTHQVTPAKLNQAGYDGTLTGADGKQLRISVKNYGNSTYQRDFEKRAQKFEKFILALFAQYQYLPCQIILEFPTLYPGDREWQLLYDAVPTWFSQHLFDNMPFCSIVEPINPQLPSTAAGNARVVFTLTLGPFRGAQLAEFHLAYQSYSCVALAAYHQNEYKNLYSKLEEACANLTRHSAVETADSANALFIHLPDTVSLAQGEEWVQRYFTSYPHKPISCVMLYQPAIVQNLLEKNSVLTNGFKFCVKEDSPFAQHFHSHYTIAPAVGQVSLESANKMLAAERGNSMSPVLPLYDRYLYQHGEHYCRMQADGTGSFTGSMSSYAGVHTHAVIDPTQLGLSPGPDNPTMVLRARHPAEDTLLIL
jgi:hypothetical protein